MLRKCYLAKRTIGSFLSQPELNDIAEVYQTKDLIVSSCQEKQNGRQMPTVQTVEKPLVNIKNGVAGAKPPTGSRGGSPSNIAPFLGKGVWG